MSLSVALCGWELQPADRELLFKIGEKFKTILPDIENISVTDIKELEPHESDIYIAFGQIAYNSLSASIEAWQAPGVAFLIGPQSREYKQKVLNIFEEIKISVEKAKQAERDKLIVENDNHISIGVGGDIEITDKEAQYLKNIKDIVGGGKIIIKKGDIEIVIEDK